MPQHTKEPEGVSDGTGTQVEIWMVNKWKAKIVKGNYIIEGTHHGEGIGKFGSYNWRRLWEILML